VASLLDPEVATATTTPWVDGGRALERGGAGGSVQLLQLLLMLLSCVYGLGDHSHGCHPSARSQ